MLAIGYRSARFLLMPLITLSSDFEKQSYGCGAMEGLICEICPDARVIHHHHGIAGFDILQAARSMETLITMPVGIHVCVVDPGVGTNRRAIAIRVKRGDLLIGPDNGLFRPAARLLGGIEAVRELTNPKYQRQPVSPIFHGRDIFAAAAGHLASGVPLADFGKELRESDLHPAPYKDAMIEGNRIVAMVIHINRFGTLFFNILQEAWDAFGVPPDGKVTLQKGRRKIVVRHTRTFGDVPPRRGCIMKDDYTRVEAAINRGNLQKRFPVKIGDRVTISR